MSLLQPGATVFVTGASGFVGTHAIKELVAHGYKVTGLARSDAAAATIEQLGARTVRGTIEDHQVLEKAAREADAVVHLAFVHDFSDPARGFRVDAEAIKSLGDALAGSDKPLMFAGATGFAANHGRVTTEDDGPVEGGLPGRAANESVGFAYVGKGVRALSLRLSPSVHGAGDQALVPIMMNLARKAGFSAYPLDGKSRWTGVHVEDAASLIRLALEHAPAGSVLNAAESEGFSQRELAEVIGERLSLPVKSLSESEVKAHFTFIAHFVLYDAPVSSKITREKTGWAPSRPALFEEIKAGLYDNASGKY